ncbi:MAG: YicC family protein [Calditrichaeota bacterium]|nr:YicC family protein [Calditrichota bacterium]
MLAKSMTGYGVGRAGDENLSVAVELRSVNNRFLDFAFKLPRGLIPFEAQIRNLIRSRIERGRISVSVSEEWTSVAAGDVRLDRGKAMLYVRLLKELQSIAGLKGELKLEHLLEVGELFTTSVDEAYQQRLWSLTQKALLNALDVLTEVASREGQHLARDILERLVLFNEQFQSVKRYAADQVAQYRDRLAARLEELLNDSRIDRSRLETEIAIAADRLDISEEIVRLESHLSAFNVDLQRKDVVGRKLKFLLEEMGREVNTISQKAWVVEITQAVVQMKGILEQIREQVQNIE